jgi:hypothetical protein
MFVIPCKYCLDNDFITPLVGQIRHYHPDEPIVVVDSNSSDKSYFDKVKDFGAVVEDVGNANWMIGAYWHAFKKYPNEEFYYFLHDSMKVKDNLDTFKNRDLTIIAYFNRGVSASFNAWNYRIERETLYPKDSINTGGMGVYGPIIMCKNKVFKSLLDKKVDLLLPSNKAETGFLEGAYGLILEAEGYNLVDCSLYGDILELESPNGRSGTYPHRTSWQYPIEKFYGSHVIKDRGW